MRAWYRRGSSRRCLPSTGSEIGDRCRFCCQLPRRRCGSGHTCAVAIRRRRRWVLIGLAGVVAVLAGGFVIVRYVLFRDTTTAVAREKVLARYRSSTSTSTSTSPATTATA